MIKNRKDLRLKSAFYSYSYTYSNFNSKSLSDSKLNLIKDW